MDTEEIGHKIDELNEQGILSYIHYYPKMPSCTKWEVVIRPPEDRVLFVAQIGERLGVNKYDRSQPEYGILGHTLDEAISLTWEALGYGG